MGGYVHCHSWLVGLLRKGAPLFEATAARMEKLSNAERAAELVYDGMRKGTMPREEFCRRMSALDQLGWQGVVASSYATWFILRNQKACPEKEHHMRTLTARLRAALAEQTGLE